VAKDGLNAPDRITVLINDGDDERLAEETKDGLRQRRTIVILPKKEPMKRTMTMAAVSAKIQLPDQLQWQGKYKI
jgi:hypothetical protein